MCIRDSVEADRFTLPRSTGHQQVRHLGQVDYECLVLNRLAQYDRDIVGRLLELDVYKRQPLRSTAIAQ